MVLAWSARKLAQKPGPNVLVLAVRCSVAHYRVRIAGCEKERDRRRRSFLLRGLYVWRSVGWLIAQDCGTRKAGLWQDTETVALHEAAAFIHDPIPTVSTQRLDLNRCSIGHLALEN